MSETVFRQMREKDVARVAQIEKICFITPWSYNSLLGELSNDVAYYVVAVDGDEVCGYAGMWVMFDEAHMTNIAVDPEHRKQGIARKMILHLMKTAMDKGAERMTLEVRENNHNAQRLYASLDFAYAGTRKHYYSDTGENALILWNDCIIETYERNINKDA
ncbi:MAG: ribosomal protein S18-alanine N-acetyltransferase [Clostridia bacterium]|jgi:ribosomal-protein-alanine N-acetyltransferase|nr:ribosomal protein S18-alanine N-acetyltransferase [Clostridia bacterium]MBR6109146.1 ribosomal protein S18-alanine N-acetyltransferase [Clostridia bacterium]